MNVNVSGRRPEWQVTASWGATGPRQVNIVDQLIATQKNWGDASNEDKDGSLGSGSRLFALFPSLSHPFKVDRARFDCLPLFFFSSPVGYSLENSVVTGSLGSNDA